MTDDSSLSDDRRDRGRRLEAVVRDRWRDRRGVSGLARDTAISRATLYSWFRGDTTPDLDSAARLAEALGMPPSELLAVLGGEEAPPEPGFARQQMIGTPDDDLRRGAMAGPIRHIPEPIHDRARPIRTCAVSCTHRPIDARGAVQVRRRDAWRRDLRGSAATASAPRRPSRPAGDDLSDR